MPDLPTAGVGGGESAIMIQAYVGTNSYAMREAVRRRLDAFVAEYTDMALEQFDCEEASADKIRESLQSLPFLVSRKLVVLRKASANKQFLADAEALLADVPETTDVLLIEPKPDKRTAYYKFLQKHTTLELFDELNEDALSAWVVAYAKGQGASIGRADARFLVARVGVNQRLIANEVDKLVLYDAAITRQTIALLVEATPQSTIFELLEAGFAGRHADMLRMYAEQRKMSVEPQQIMAMIAWQLHVLALVIAAGNADPAQVARESGVNAFVLRKSSSVARRLSATGVRKLVHQAAVLDVRLKSVPIDADDAVQHFLLGLHE